MIVPQTQFTFAKALQLTKTSRWGYEKQCNMAWWVKTGWLRTKDWEPWNQLEAETWGSNRAKLNKLKFQFIQLFWQPNWTESPPPSPGLKKKESNSNWTGWTEKLNLMVRLFGFNRIVLCPVAIRLWNVEREQYITETRYGLVAWDSQSQKFFSFCQQDN